MTTTVQSLDLIQQCESLLTEAGVTFDPNLKCLTSELQTIPVYYSLRSTRAGQIRELKLQFLDDLGHSHSELIRSHKGVINVKLVTTKAQKILQESTECLRQIEERKANRAQAEAEHQVFTDDWKRRGYKAFPYDTVVESSRGTLHASISPPRLGKQPVITVNLQTNNADVADQMYRLIESFLSDV